MRTLKRCAICALKVSANNAVSCHGTCDRLICKQCIPKARTTEGSHRALCAECGSADDTSWPPIFEIKYLDDSPTGYTVQMEHIFNPPPYGEPEEVTEKSAGDETSLGGRRQYSSIPKRRGSKRVNTKSMRAKARTSARVSKTETAASFDLPGEAAKRGFSASTKTPGSYFLWAELSKVPVKVVIKKNRLTIYCPDEEDKAGSATGGWKDGFTFYDEQVLTLSGFNPEGAGTGSIAQNAWLLLGDEKSFDSDEVVAKAWEEGQSYRWTCSPWVEAGDLVFIYFVAPSKSIQFVSRALSGAYWANDIAVNALTGVNQHQWWCDLQPPTRIAPISFAELKAAGGPQNLRGRSGKPITPKAAARLLRGARPASDVYSKKRPSILDTKVWGRVGLPNPSRSTLAQWRTIPTGAFRLEGDVEQNVIGPLLRLAGLHVKAGYRLKQQVRMMSGGIADYVIYQEDRPALLIEAKQRIRGAAPSWAGPDLDQVREYSQELKVPFLLVDCGVVVGFEATTKKPAFEFQRITATLSDLGNVRRLAR